VANAIRSIKGRAAKKLVGRLGNQLTLETGAFGLECVGRTLSLAASNDRGAVGAACDHFVQGHLSLEAVGQTDSGHAEMHQVGDDRKQRDLLSGIPPLGHISQ